MKARVLTITALSVLLAATQVDAQTRAVSLDSVSGLNWEGKIQIDVPVTFYIGFSNSGDSMKEVENGFRVYSPDGAQWQPLTHVPYGDLSEWVGYHPQWSEYFLLVLVDELGVTGSGADSLHFVSLALPTAGYEGLPAEFSDVVYTISTQVDADQAGKTLCLDSLSLPPLWRWQWINFDLEHISPTWDGPHCFTIESDADTLDFTIALDSVDGLIEGTSDGLLPDVPVTFYLKFINPPAKNRYIWSVRNAFCVYSPDGATWEPLEHLPWYNSGTSSWEVYYPGWNVYPYFDANLFANNLNVTGSGADTIDFGGAATLLGQQDDGLEPGFSEKVYTITTQFDAGQIGKTICLDKAEHWNLDWEWKTHTAGTVSPAWGGPYCFTIKNPADTIDFTIALDSVDGLVEGTSDELQPGVPITFYLRFLNPPAKGQYIWSVENAFCVYSPDGATWEPLEHLPWYNSGTSNWEVYYTGWNVYPYFDANLFANNLNVTGSGADTIDFGGAATLLGEQEDGLEPGFSEKVYTITTQFDAGQIGKTICLDKAEHWNLDWEWKTHTAGTVSPIWDGPYCFTVVEQPDFDDDGVPDMADNCPFDYNPLQEDFNGDGTGDACCCTGMRGNANSDLEDKCNISDITYLVKYLFGIPTGPPPDCPAEGNANSDLDEKANIADITYLVIYLFGMPPGPPPQDCP